MKKKIAKWFFWGGLILLVVDLLSYLSSIRLYFTTFGQILLVASILLIILGGIKK